MILTFVTGNAGKLTEARRVFAGTGIEIRGCRADFDEPRSADPAAIAGKKLAQARGLIPPPYFVLRRPMSTLRSAPSGWRASSS